MSVVDDNEPERGSDDMIAAEYVLGVLPADERQAASRRIEAEPAFARLVEQWELHLSPMAGEYPSIEPPASVKAALDRRLFEAAAPRSTVKPAAPGLWSSLSFWRGLAAAAVAALLVYAAAPFIAPTAVEPGERLVASLAPNESDVHYLVVYDARNQDVGLSHVSGERAEGRDFELWMIEGEQPPVSLGVIPVGSNVHLAVSDELRRRIDAGAVFAVSVEPQGGSTTGQPTGPVVAAGDLKQI